MKKNTFIAVLIAAITFISLSCQAQRVNETNVTFLVDVTDPVVFEEDIVTDFEQNLNAFFTNAGIARIDFGERLRVRMAPIDESDRLTLHSNSIALLDKGVSRKKAEKQRNPRPLVQLIKSELDQYKSLSQKKNAFSPIISLTLKTLRELDPETREILVIVTDGIEHSTYGDFYKSIPTTEKSVNQLIAKIDPLLLEEAKRQADDSSPEVIIVLKNNPKVKTAELKKFYSLFLTRLGVTTIRFIDNLSNNTNL